MLTESGRQSPRWRRGLAAGDWDDDDRTYAALLDALTRDIVATEATQLELDAGARRSPADVEDEQERIEKEQLTESRQELTAFRAALRDARERGGEDGRAEVAYDSAQPEQDEQAGLLIQYLVRPDYAEVRTEEPEPGRHVYYIRIAWDRLRELAEEQGIGFAV